MIASRHFFSGTLRADHLGEPMSKINRYYKLCEIRHEYHKVGIKTWSPPKNVLKPQHLL